MKKIRDTIAFIILFALAGCNACEQTNECPDFPGWVEEAANGKQVRGWMETSIMRHHVNNVKSGDPYTSIIRVHFTACERLERAAIVGKLTSYGDRPLLQPNGDYASGEIRAIDPTGREIGSWGLNPPIMHSGRDLLFRMVPDLDLHPGQSVEADIEIRFDKVQVDERFNLNVRLIDSARLNPDGGIWIRPPRDGLPWIKVYR